MSDENKEDDGPNRIMVFLRIRPAKKGEINPPETDYLMQIADDNKNLTVEGKPYNFDRIFDGPDVRNKDMYEEVGKPVAGNIFKGFWGTMMVYGQTGTGKSFTMCNFDKNNLGIIPLTMKGIFDRIDTETDRVYTVNFSFIQIYRDKLQDLFNPHEKEELKVTRDKNGVCFPKIKEYKVNDYDHFEELYYEGNQYRVITATKMNPESSRGHASLFLTVKSAPKDDPAGESRAGKLFMIDLAGYERFSKTGVQEGVMKEEAKTINASLLSLGNVVGGLAEGNSYVPWRDSKLTRMLEDAIGGKAKCSIILTAGPSNEHLHETTGTLYFGFRAMSVKTTATAFVNVDYKKLSAQLKEMLKDAQGQIASLEAIKKRMELERLEFEERQTEQLSRIRREQKRVLDEHVAKGSSAAEIQKALEVLQEQENELVEGTRVQRAALDERQKEELAEAEKAVEALQITETLTIDSDQTEALASYKKEVAELTAERDSLKKKLESAEAEAKRCKMEFSELKQKWIMEGGDLEGMDIDVGDDAAPGSPTAPGTGGAGGGGGGGGRRVGGMSTIEMKKEIERRIGAVKEMLEETYSMRMAEVTDPLTEEMEKYRKLYEDLKKNADENLAAQKDALTEMYDNEIAEIKQHNIDVQERLKKNHMTIKKAHQRIKEELQEENDRLSGEVEMLREKLGGDAPAASASVAKRDGPSVAEVMIMKKKTERQVSELENDIRDLKADLDYANTEKEALAKELESYRSAGEVRMAPGQVRKLKEDFEQLSKTKRDLEQELFRAKAAQVLSTVTTAGEKEEDNPMDVKPDICGDIAGMPQFIERINKKVLWNVSKAATHEQVLKDLDVDLEDYRRAMRMRLVFIGAPASGKSSIIKCMVTPSAPMRKSCPEVQPTVHPSIQSGSIDSEIPKKDMHTLYVKLEDLAEKQEKKSLFGLGKATEELAKTYVDIIEYPGSTGWWRGCPPMFLSGRNTYMITYDMTQPMDQIKEEIARHLGNIHASAHKHYPRCHGGDTPRIAVCLLGTRRESVRDDYGAMNERKVHAFLNEITESLGDVFFRLRGMNNAGIVLLDHFAISCRDWTITSPRPKTPTTLRELFVWASNISAEIHDIRPSALLPQTSETAAFGFMLGDASLSAAQEKPSALGTAEKRLRKGVVTLVTSLYQQQKKRWLMFDSELRQLVAEHMGLDLKISTSISAVNYVIRELISRAVIAVLPSHIYEKKYAPKSKEDEKGEESLPRDGIVVLEPQRLLVLYSAFIAPTCIVRLPKGTALADKKTMFFDYDQFIKVRQLWRVGLIESTLNTVTCKKLFPLVGSDVNLLAEILCVSGYGLSLKSKSTILAPCQFSANITPALIEYLTFLLANYGDGIGRKYSLNCCPESFFARLQLMLCPFSHAPATESNAFLLNWSDASYLLFDRSRLKHGIFGSYALKDAVMKSTIPMRGFMKREENSIYIVITARTENSVEAQESINSLLAAIHHQMLVLTTREYRGVRVQYQEVSITGAKEKWPKLEGGVKSILNRFDYGDEYEDQWTVVQALKDEKSPRAKTAIDDALNALPEHFIKE